MSIGAVEARIAQIQGELQRLTPSAPMNGAVFAQMMSGASAAYAPGATAASGTAAGTGSADAVIATARQYVAELRSITIVEGGRSGVTYSRGRLTVTVNPNEGLAGRPSSARVIRAILPG